MERKKLKYCPFCKGEAVIHNCGIFENETAQVIFGDRVGVHCTECYIATIPYASEEEAVEAWNRRADDEKGGERV